MSDMTKNNTEIKMTAQEAIQKVAELLSRAATTAAVARSAWGKELAVPFGIYMRKQLGIVSMTGTDLGGEKRLVGVMIPIDAALDVVEALRIASMLGATIPEAQPPQVFPGGPIIFDVDPSHAEPKAKN